MKGLIRTPRAHLVAKLVMAALAFWALFELRGPWWHMALGVFCYSWIVVDAVQAYRREITGTDPFSAQR